mmetsp:Transcript_34328/g.52600  ORF Transcript_34328/g.52600 Transcript_34328/m.52600 type:complete len:114 (-) Transcript_34328:2366-2707(-)
MSSDFVIDFFSTIPFDLIMRIFVTELASNKFKLLKLMKLLRLLRLSRLINYINTTDDFKIVLNLFKICLFLILYIHCTACLIFYVANQSQLWVPNQFLDYHLDEGFYDADPVI